MFVYLLFYFLKVLFNLALAPVNSYEMLVLDFYYLLVQFSLR